MKVGDRVKTTVTGIISKMYNEEKCMVTIHGEEVPMLTSQLQREDELLELLRKAEDLLDDACQNIMFGGDAASSFSIPDYQKWQKQVRQILK